MEENLNGSFRVSEEKLKQSSPHLYHRWQVEVLEQTLDETLSVVYLFITQC